MRGAYAKRFSGDAPPVVALFSCFLVCLRVIGVCLSRRPRRAAPRVTGGDSRPLAQPPTCIKDKHTPNCHLPIFGYFSCFSGLYFCTAVRTKKGSLSAAFGRKYFYTFDKPLLKLGKPFSVIFERLVKIGEVMSPRPVEISVSRFGQVADSDVGAGIVLPHEQGEVALVRSVAKYDG